MIEAVQAIVVVCALTCCVLLRSVCDLKASQINMLCSCLIWEFILEEFKLSHKCYKNKPKRFVV